MGLKHIFISHASADAEIATQLANHLRNAGHDTKVDTRDLNLGDNCIAYMNQSIAEAHTVIILFSKHSAKAKWQQLEIDSAVWNEVAQGGGFCIIVLLDDTTVPPILGPKIYGKLNPDNPVEFQKLVEAICKVSMPNKTASTVVAEALGVTSKNPFRYLRAEFFENSPDLLAKTFAPPDAFKVGSLEEMKPCLIEGSRGTGKSMLLLSLRARNYLQRHKEETDTIQIYGFYLKLSRGAICNTGAISTTDPDTLAISEREAMQITDIAAQEIIIQLIESLFSELLYCINKHFINWDRMQEKLLVEALDSLLFDKTKNQATSLDEILEKLADIHKRVADFIRRRFIYEEQCPVPVAIYDLEQFKRVIKLIRRYIPTLKETMFIALLDEYENLFPYQQRIVNGFVKFGPPDISVKIAKKLGTTDNPGTTTGQEIQEIHDYTRISLVYDVEDITIRKAYYDLLRNIVRNIFQSENLGLVDIDKLLPEDISSEVPKEKLKMELVKLCKASIEEFDTWPEERRAEKWTYYGEAATYRALLGGKGRHSDKRYSGFSQLAFVSSGVIRYFQEILGVAYHLTFGTEAPKADMYVLPPDKQTKAVHLVSQHNLTTLSRSVERDGETLKYFLMDIGHCLRHKLLEHTSEPEAARLTIEDPESLKEEQMAPLKHLLAVGVREGVFQTKEGLPAIKPKHSSDPQPSEFNICRIYAPVLEISPRLRWRTNVMCSSLLGLLLPGQRSHTIQQLKTMMVKPKRENQQGELGFFE